ncbi:lipopolysaccharide biosynthesis protein [Pseudactinotalea sp.]|uniref:lipopolysaccharide biosynthesis protein n=1 Tax=Pseudactinotalea sp. TaxID=1926260 RepID=UPI003B3B4F83
MRSEGLTRSGVVSLVGSAVAALGALVLTSLVGHSLGAHGTGLFFQAVGIFTVASQVLRLGTNSGIVRFISADRAHDRQGQEWRIVLIALLPVAVGSGLASVALWLWSDQLALLFSNSSEAAELDGLLRVMAPFVLVGAVSGVVQIAARMVRGVTAFTMLQSILPAIARLATVAVGLMMLNTAGAAFAAWLIPLPVWLLVGIALIWRPLAQDWRRRAAVASVDRVGVRQFWRFNGPRAVGAGLETGLQWADVLIVAALTTPAQAGIYAVATRAVRAGEVVDKAMRVAVSPTISGLLARGEVAATSRLHARVVRGMVIVSWPFYLVLAINGPAVLAIFGDEFVVGWPILSILAIAMMCQTAAGMLQSILLQAGRSSWQMCNKTIALTLSVGLNVLLVPHWGIVGAALTWAIVVLVDNGIAAYQVHRLMRVRLQPSTYLPVALLAVVVVGAGAVVTRQVGGTSLLWLLLGIALTGMVYTALLWVWRRRLGTDYLWQKVPVIGSYARGRSSTPSPSALDDAASSSTGSMEAASPGLGSSRSQESR